MPFNRGLPGSMKAVYMLVWASDLKIALETNPGPLSLLRYCGAP
jgi:hypothetical protein